MDTATRPEIEDRVEAERGCGFRKPGGLYLVAPEGSWEPCGRLPIPLDVCPTCNQGIKQSRGWTWVDPKPLLAPNQCSIAMQLTIMGNVGAACVPEDQRLLHSTCPLADENLPEKVGLLWIGKKFYATPADFMDEAKSKGISRRIPAVPRGFELGNYVMLAHDDAISTVKPDCDEWTPKECYDWLLKHCEEMPPGTTVLNPEAILAEIPTHEALTWRLAVLDTAKSLMTPGIFTMFKPTAVEYVTSGEETDEELTAMAERDITLVKVTPDVETGDEEDDPCE